MAEPNANARAQGGAYRGGDGGGLGSCDLGDDDLGLPGWRSEGFVQWYTVWIDALGRSGIEVTDSVYDPERDEWSNRAYTAQDPQRMTSVASAGRDLFCTAGQADDGECVLQVWHLVSKLSGEAPGAHDEPRRSLESTEIYRGPVGKHCGVLQLDFDAGRGRFLLGLVQEGPEVRLYEWRNEAGATPTCVAGPETYPALNLMSHVRTMQHQDLGRVWYLTPSPFANHDVRMIFPVDPNGMLAGEPIVGTYEDFDALGIMNYEKWDSLMSVP